MFCMNCGTKLPDGAKFCMNCGTKLGEVSPTPSPAEKKYPSYAMQYPNSMVYLDSPAYQRERELMKHSELGSTPYSGFDFTNYAALEDGTMVGFVFGHTDRCRHSRLSECRLQAQRRKSVCAERHCILDV